jgi:hypothetical protein
MKRNFSEEMTQFVLKSTMGRGLVAVFLVIGMGCTIILVTAGAF